MQETSEHAHERLLEVIAKSRFEVLPQPYAWQGIPDSMQLPNDALAAVRDGETWYALAPTISAADGTYRVFSFHFAEGTNASGFVAWLAGLMRDDAGTGAMVVCGFDARGSAALWRSSLGLFDYWGCRWSKGDAVIALVERLRGVGSIGR